MKLQSALSSLIAICSVQLISPAFASSSAADTTASQTKIGVVAMSNSAHRLDFINYAENKDCKHAVFSSSDKTTNEERGPQKAEITEQIIKRPKASEEIPKTGGVPIEELHATPMLSGHCSVWHQFSKEG